MATHYHFMPIDKSTIKTRLRIHPDLLDDPNTYILKRNIQVRTGKPTRGTSKRGPTRNLTLDVLTYKGIKLKLSKVTADPLTDATIDFNPGVCLYGHNGSALSLAGFLDALACIVSNLTPLLSDSGDWIDLIPGLRSGGVAYWTYLEILSQCADFDGRLLSGFRHAQHPRIRTPTRHWDQSIEIGRKRGKLQLSIYRKAVEMVAHDKLPMDRLNAYWHILRIEARLAGKKLLEYLGNERNVEEIDGEDRLVRFYPQDVVHGYREILGEIQGVYSSNEPLGEVGPKNQMIPLGRLLARVALATHSPETCSELLALIRSDSGVALDTLTTKTFPELLALVRFYTGASSDTMGKIRKAGMAALSSQSSISMDDLLSDAAYNAQHSVASENLERMVSHDGDAPHPLIYKAYQPPDQPFQPNTQLPTYIQAWKDAELRDTDHD